jgi:Leucine-rich repeat (LRR) protein
MPCEIMPTLKELCLNLITDLLTQESSACKLIKRLNESQWHLGAIPAAILNHEHQHDEEARCTGKRLHLSAIPFFRKCTIKELDLTSSFHTGHASMEDLLSRDIPENFKELERLSIRRSLITDYGMSYLVNYHFDLQHLDISASRGFSLESLELLNNMEQLISLSLEECGIHFDDWPLRECKKLQEVRLGGNDLTCRTFQSLLQTCAESLQVLSIWGADCLGSIETEMMLIEAVQLHTLDMHWVPSLSGCFSDVLANMNALTCLDCSHTNVNDYGVASFVDKPIKDLNLSFSGAQYASLVHISQMTSLQYVYLSNLCIDGEGAADAWSFAGLDMLRSVDMSQCTFKFSQRHWEALVSESAYLFPQGLRILKLSGIIGETSALVGSLSKLSKLRALDLSENTSPAFPWDRALQGKPKLRSLNVSSSNVTEFALLDCLGECRRSLEELHMEGLHVPSCIELRRLRTFPKVTTVAFPVTYTDVDMSKLTESVFPAYKSKSRTVLNDADTSVKSVVRAQANAAVEGQTQRDNQGQGLNIQKSTPIKRLAPKNILLPKGGAKDMQCGMGNGTANVHGLQSHITNTTTETETEVEKVSSQASDCIERNKVRTASVSIESILELREAAMSAFRPPGLATVKGVTDIACQEPQRGKTGRTISLGDWPGRVGTARMR